MRYVPVMFTVPRCALAGRDARNRSQRRSPAWLKKYRFSWSSASISTASRMPRALPSTMRPFVQRAAELMGFHVVRVPPDNAELHALSEGLPLGKIFATGRAFVPFVARAAFDKLATLVEGGVTIEARAAAGVAPVYPLADIFTTEAVNTAEALWSKIEVGTVVLASQPDVWGPGW